MCNQPCQFSRPSPVLEDGTTVPVAAEVAQLEGHEPSHRGGKGLQVIGVGTEGAQSMHVAKFIGELTYLVPADDQHKTACAHTRFPPGTAYIGL